MTELLTAAQMRAIEATAIESGAVTGLALMERAGQGVVDAIFAEWPELASGAHRAVVLCGPGNNGGDGFVVARLLHDAGWNLDVFLYGDAAKLPPDAKANYERWAQTGAVAPLTDETLKGYAHSRSGMQLVIDALFGTGLTRPLAALGRAQDEVNYWHAVSTHKYVPHMVSIDMPSGLCADSGRYLGHNAENPADMCIRANLTVTFHRAKLGHYLCDGPKACGTLAIVDIGL